VTDRTAGDRRITALETRLEQIDQRGTRGMEAVRAQLGGVERDLGKVESAVDRIEGAISTMQLQLAALRPPRQWPAIVAYLGVLLPLYVLVIDLVVTRR
jgi:hypothetical protein